MHYGIVYHITFSASESVTQSHALTKTIRGYTGHEMLPHFALINMNGRMYDPVLGRMLSPDNYVQDPNKAQNYNRYTYVLNNPLKYTDPSGKVPIIIPIIGAIIGAYLGGAATNNWDMTPWKSGEDDKTWDFNNPTTYFGIVVGAIAGATISAYAYGLLFENAAINLTIGTSIGNTFNGFANFIVSNSGIIFDGIGYTTIAGGAAYYTHKTIKQYWDGPYYQGSEEEAKDMLLTSSKTFNVETSYWKTSRGYYFAPIQGYAYGYRYNKINMSLTEYNTYIGYKTNMIDATYRYTYVEIYNENLYIYPNIFQRSRVYYKAHTHPRSSPPGVKDLLFSYLFKIKGVVYGWHGSEYKYGGQGYW